MCNISPYCLSIFISVTPQNPLPMVNLLTEVLAAHSMRLSRNRWRNKARGVKNARREMKHLQHESTKRKTCVLGKGTMQRDMQLSTMQRDRKEREINDR